MDIRIGCLGAGKLDGGSFFDRSTGTIYYTIVTIRVAMSW